MCEIRIIGNANPINNGAASREQIDMFFFKAMAPPSSTFCEMLMLKMSLEDVQDEDEELLDSIRK